MNSGSLFGEWLVVQRAAPRRRPSGLLISRWLCECSCGVRKCVESASLLNGRSKCCGHRRRLVGPSNPGWKGGKTTDTNGYVVINGPKINGFHPRRRLEHRLVMERHLLRKLKRHETVHHKNGIRSDNRLRNLELWSSWHPPGQRVSDLISWSKRILRLYYPKALC